MKIVCDIEALDESRPDDWPNNCIEWTYLTIGYYEEDRGTIYMLRQTRRNPVGFKYKVSGNVMGIYTHFIESNHEARIRFNKPRVQLLIFSTEVQLRQFCRIVKKFMSEEIDASYEGFTNLTNLPKHVLPREEINLHVHMSSTVPLMRKYTNTLEELLISRGSHFQYFETLQFMENLRVLNIERNSIEDFPKELSSLKNLKELHLGGNLLGLKPIDSWLLAGNFLTGLVYLDLTKNRIKELPKTMYKLKGLRTLLLSCNYLEYLPSTFGRIPNLKKLDVSNNGLVVLPPSFRLFKLKELIVNGNRAFGAYCRGYDKLSPKPWSLFDFSAKAILKYRLEYDSDILPRLLIDYLDNASYCVCGQATFPIVPEALVKFDFTTVSERLIKRDKHPLPIETRYCSDECRATWAASL